MQMADDNPGLFTFLAGMIVLVMTAVGLSILVDKRLHSSSRSGDLKQEILDFGEEIGTLEARREGAARRLESEAPARRNALANQRELERLRAGAADRRGELAALRTTLQSETAALEREFAAYREKFRSRSRARAAGEAVGVLETRDGRKFNGVTIRKVTDVGMDISHEHGFARIHAPDLGPAWQERFQWTDEERRARLEEERRNRERVAGPAAPAPREIPAKLARANPPAAEASVPEAEIIASRQSYLGWKSKVAQLSSDKSEADFQAASGSRTSVPGSLETWRARADRLSAQLVRARSEYAAARARLGIVAPDDPLLRPQPLGN